MRIYQNIRFHGAINTVYGKALIDTGADISMIPLGLAEMIGALHICKVINIRGVFGQDRTLPLRTMCICFPSLKNIGMQIPVAVSDVEQIPIIGMDVLKPLGITIDTKTGQLSVKHEGWEVFKTMAGVVAIIIFGAEVVDYAFGKTCQIS